VASSPAISADAQAVARTAAKLSVALNIPPSADRVRLLAEMLTEAGWTADLIREAEAAILADPELLAMVRRAGAVTVEPFVEWRRRRDTPKTLGPCFTFGCRTPATVAAWGDIYCQSCYEGHVRRHKARDARQYAANPDFCLRPPEDEPVHLLGGLIRSRGQR